jgi:hypothetical protein
MPSKNLTTLSFSTFLFLVSHGVVAATTAAVFFGTGFLLLTHSWEEIKPAATTANQPAPTDATVATVNQPVPTDATAATVNQPVPTDATAATAVQPAPSDATAATANQPETTAVPYAMRPNYPASPTIVAMRVNPPLIATFTRAAANKGISLEQYRDARLRFLRQQQSQLELQLTEPNLSAGQTRRLERQKAYWGRAIEQTLALP